MHAPEPTAYLSSSRQTGICLLIQFPPSFALRNDYRQDLPPSLSQRDSTALPVARSVMASRNRKPERRPLSDDHVGAETACLRARL